jgi:hypothetical protein
MMLLTPMITMRWFELPEGEMMAAPERPIMLLLELTTTSSQVMVPETLTMAAPLWLTADFNAAQVVTVVVGPPSPPVVPFCPDALTEAQPIN